MEPTEAPSTTPAEIAAFEQRVGWKLDPDLRASWPDPYYCERIEDSFSEFLEAALRARRPAYWLER